MGMNVHYTTTQTAEEIADRLAVGSARPVIHKAKITALVRAHRVDDVGTGGRAKITRAQVDEFAAATRYVPDIGELLAVNPRVLQVAVLPRGSDAGQDVVEHAHTGVVLRTDSGVDYALPPSDPVALGGWEGVWPIAGDDLDDLCSGGGLLLASCKGYVAPGYVRTVVGHSPVLGSTRRYLHTAPAAPEVEAFLGTGIWIDTKSGGVCHLLGPRAPRQERLPAS